MTTIWHDSAPPHAGWWLTRLVLAGRYVYSQYWRCWNGSHWSFPVSEAASPRIAGRAARMIDHSTGAIQWCNYWPEHARVPRIDPRDE